MAAIIEDKITQAIYQRLLDNVKAVEIVQPSMWATFSPQSYQVVLSPGDPEPNEDFSCQGNPPGQAYTIVYTVVCFIQQDNEDDRPIDTLIAEFAGAVYSTITQPAAWWQWGGEAIDTRPGPITKFVADGFAARQMQFTVIYRVDEDDPYTRR
jgi:phenylpropionate dioxygenase-like ring-hydroxylating dioxygenase large terminal subunit